MSCPRDEICQTRTSTAPQEPMAQPAQVMMIIWALRRLPATTRRRVRTVYSIT